MNHLNLIERLLSGSDDARLEAEALVARRPGSESHHFYVRIDIPIVADSRHEAAEKARQLMRAGQVDGALYVAPEGRTDWEEFDG